MSSHHAICPPMRYFKAMKAVSFILKKRNSTVFGRFRVINCHTQYESYQGNACISQGKHVQQKYPVKTQFNFVSRKQKELEMS